MTRRSRLEVLARVEAAKALLARNPTPPLDGQETIPIEADESDDPKEKQCSCTASGTP
ncbi:hypothetical protein AB0933_32785 [Streptomyces venezuelae]|uniref:hypothetical protein n=1 Tax=Streptomyces venezuelae TaxID=54571 RepID=UPI003456ACD2